MICSFTYCSKSIAKVFFIKREMSEVHVLMSELLVSVFKAGYLAIKRHKNVKEVFY